MPARPARTCSSRSRSRSWWPRGAPWSTPRDVTSASCRSAFIAGPRPFHVQNEWPKGMGAPPDEDPPADFDWEAWLGPAPKRAYNKNRTFYRFRWFYDYSGGQLTNFGVHYMDAIHWALGHDAPRAVTAMGGKVALEDNREIPDTLE